MAEYEIMQKDWYGEKFDVPFFGRKWICFVKGIDRPKTESWDVENNKSGDLLGVIEFYPPFRQYGFIPFGDTVYDDGCLRDILDFVVLLNEKKKLAPEFTGRWFK